MRLFPVVILIALGACVNEPFELLPLGVTDFSNLSTGTTSLYTYKSGSLQSVLNLLDGDSVSTMKFLYEDDLLTSIVKDSTAESYELVRFYGYGSTEVTDSTFLITA